MCGLKIKKLTLLVKKASTVKQIGIALLKLVIDQVAVYLQLLAILEIYICRIAKLKGREAIRIQNSFISLATSYHGIIYI